MNKWIKIALIKNSDIFSKTHIGTSSQQRKLNVLKISTGRNNMAVFVLGGEEARDWISAEIVLNLLEELLYRRPLNNLLQYYDFYFLPLLNPDGYEYSRTMNRFWSKNRRPIFLHPQRSCKEDEKATGVNLDRNWYNTNPGEFGDEYECEAINIGKESLSEVETKSLAYFLSSIAPTLMLFVNVRGFANIITVPYGYTRSYPENFSLMLEILKSAHKSVYDKYNATYDYGNSARLLFNVSGSCADWVKKELNVPLVYTVYMMNEDHIMPLRSDSRVLTSHLLLLLEEILTISKQIYGPVYNNSFKASNVDTTLTIVIAILMTYF